MNLDADQQFFIGADLGMVNSILAFTDESGTVNVQRWEDGQSHLPTHHSPISMTSISILMELPKDGS